MSCTLVVTAVTAVLAAVSGLAAQVPRTRGQVTLYPAAVLDTGGRKTDWEVNRQSDGSVIEAASFRVPASVSAVVRSYAQKLGATRTADQGGALETESLAPGAVTGATYEVTFYELADEHHEPEGAGTAFTLYGKDKRAALTRVRPLDEGGKWIEGARFDWAARAANGDLAQFNLTVADDGLATDWKSYRLLTRIDVEVTTHPLSCEGSQPSAELDALCEQRRQGHVAAVAERPPTAQELGLPTYPGASFDAATTAGMSTSGQKFFVYTSTDPLEKVVSFYERATGKKGERQAETGSVLIAVKGTAPFPELGVAIQPRLPQYPATVKAVITIIRGHP